MRRNWLLIGTLGVMFGTSSAHGALETINVKRVSAPAATAPGSSVSATIELERIKTGVTTTGALAMIWCDYERTPVQSASKKWEVIDTHTNCREAAPTPTKFASVTDTSVTVSGLTAPATCPVSLVAKYGAATPDKFNDPKIARWTVVYPKQSTPELAVSKVEIASDPKKPKNWRSITAYYTLSTSVSPSALGGREVIVDTCRDDRCYVRSSALPPQSEWKFAKVKVGNKFENRWTVTTTLVTDALLTPTDYNNGAAANKVRVSFGKRPSANHIIERQCDAPEVFYEELK